MCMFFLKPGAQYAQQAPYSVLQYPLHCWNASIPDSSLISLVQLMRIHLLLLRASHSFTGFVSDLVVLRMTAPIRAHNNIDRGVICQHNRVCKVPPPFLAACMVSCNYLFYTQTLTFVLQERI